jgi:CBS-domain-containing membrane protein
LVFVLSGPALLTYFPREGWWIVIPISTGFVLVGCMLLWNSVRKNDSPKEKQKDE